MIYMLCFITGFFIGITGCMAAVFAIRWLPVLRDYRAAQAINAASGVHKDVAKTPRKTPEEQFEDMLNWQPLTTGEHENA